MAYGADNIKKYRGNPKLVVHCHAGLGRTGTTLTLLQTMLTIMEQKAHGVSDPQVSIFSIVRRLREQRENMVEKQAQYNL